MNNCQHCAVLDTFQSSIVGLRLDDDGLTDNPTDTLEHVAGMTYAVLGLTQDAETPRDLLANRLAHMAQQLIKARFMGGDGRRLVRDYLFARAELIELQANARPL
ncbi:MAG: hypothetical protein WCI78_18060 [Mycobacterium sp.]